MRPVDRGEWPTHPESKLPVELKEYGDAKPHLVARIGKYCSYCELPLKNQPAVEHVLPKSRYPQLERAWGNFLLACACCNSIKGARERVDLEDYFWPDRDNTLRALSYRAGGIVETAAELSPAEQARARRTIQLTGLDRAEGAHTRPTLQDQRWIHRSEAWEIAEDLRRDLRLNNTDPVRKGILTTAKHVGFWSIWMTVFADDPDMRRGLIAAFPGTSRACFDEQCRPVPRPAGAL